PEVGGATARLLAKHFHSLEAVRDASLEELVTVDKIGEEVAGRIRTWFDGPENLALVDALLTSGVEPATEVEGGGRSGDAFEGEVCVFTGTLESMSRFEAKAAVEAQGGKVASSVSGKTTVLVQGGKPGSKAKKAEEKGVRVLLEEDFLQRLGVTRD
ncbi:MAG: helix-hairpin-helix domain-containing protein, partial [Planctomycetota bacterium]